MTAAERAHGTRTRFVHDGCRCFPCRLANANYETERQAQRRARAPWRVRCISETGEFYVENTLTGETHRDCESQQAAYETRASLNAFWAAYHCEDNPPLWADDALIKTVVRHLRALQEEGIGLRRVAELADIGRTRLTEIVNGTSYNKDRPRKRRLKHETAMKILELEPALAPDKVFAAGGAYVPAAGTQRLIAELLAACGSRAEVARRLGYQAPALQTMNRDCVRQSNADRVREVHDAIWRGDPRADPVVERLRAVCRCPEWAR